MEGRKKHGERKVTWIEAHCTRPEHIFFCQVNKSYIRDSFNLYDLKSKFPTESIYKEALTTILDEASVRKSNANSRYSHDNAEFLYGLIHARYITCSVGLEAMRRKYISGDFGTCPRIGCGDQLVLPIGLSEVVGKDSVKIFCTKCQNVYRCPYDSVDSSYFGPTFPHLFYMSFESLVPKPLAPKDNYVPKIFGFRVHPSSTSLPTSKYYIRGSSSSPSASETGNDSEINIETIKQHNSATQLVDMSSSSMLLETENGRKRQLEDGGDEDCSALSLLEDSVAEGRKSGGVVDLPSQKRAKT